MDEATIRAKVGQLLSEVNRLPAVEPPATVDLASLSPHGPSAMRREMAAIDENLDQVRLAIKYLVFDLEATKRENRLLREMLGEA
jgi:hypothetical protein